MLGANRLLRPVEPDRDDAEECVEVEATQRTEMIAHPQLTLGEGAASEERHEQRKKEHGENERCARRIEPDERGSLHRETTEYGNHVGGGPLGQRSENGVVVDLLAAGCFGVGDGKIGCNDLSSAWRYDPMSPSANFGTDVHNAHTQPDGRYHYHGDPLAMYGESSEVSPVIGFAADGFPIYGPYFDDGGTIREARSGFSLKIGSRPSGASDPGGDYDGTFVDDYEYTGAGDLDECNGMTIDGQYGYYVTRTYPWVLACLKGAPDASFDKRP